MLKQSLLATALLLSGACSFASTGTYSALSNAVVKGFAVQMSQVNPATQKRVALATAFDELRTPFNGPFTHPDLAGGSVSLVSDTAARVCLEFLPLPKDRWVSALDELTSSGWGLAMPGSCDLLKPLAIPTHFPTKLMAYRVLEAENIPLSTSVAPFPVIEPPKGALHKAITLPSFLLTAPEGTAGSPAMLRVTNPNPPPDAALLLDPDTASLYYQQWAAASTVLTELSVPEPFFAFHGCSRVGPQESCEIGVALNSEVHTDRKPVAGSIFISFDNANFTRIGVVGRVLDAPADVAIPDEEPEVISPPEGSDSAEVPPVSEFALPYCNQELINTDETSCRVEPVHQETYAISESEPPQSAETAEQ